LRENDASPSAQTTALTALHETSPDLAKLAAAWPRLHEAVRAGIMAMVTTAQKAE
jgi:hypothetical protein